MQRNIVTPFFLKNGRAMVSLGPLHKSRYCPYSCAWCYVQDDFNLYAKLSVDEIIKFLKMHRENYKIIYISGDTDSFAPPRTGVALDLLSTIAAEVQCDLLFTTRTIFSEEHFKKLEQIVSAQKKANKMIYACISITRFSLVSANLEPYPIPLPDDRILVLKRLKEIGATTVLAMRPFLPMVDVNDYLTIIDKSKQFVDIVLGEDLYFIRGGNLEKRIFPNGISPEIELNIRRNQKMLFDDNTSLWDIWHSVEYEQTVAARCKELGIVFSMSSDSAISDYLSNTKNMEL